MKYLPYVGLIILATVSACYALKAKSISDYLLAWTARTYGDESTIFRLSKAFMGNSFYLISVVIVSGTVSILSIAALIYLLGFAPHDPY